MSRPAIDVARSLMRRREFGKAIVLLENVHDVYENSFDYYLTLGIACLYAGETGNASRYFSQARRIKVNDVQLLLAQAALFLRRGDTGEAIRYYLDVQDLEPGNKVAKKALDFVRSKGDWETIVRWNDTGKIEKFYPPLSGKNVRKTQFVLSAFAGILIAFVILFCVKANKTKENKARADLTSLSLNSLKNAELKEKDLSGQVYKFILSDKEIKESYEKARNYFQNYLDNSSRVEINRILNSNASKEVKTKAQILLTYLEQPGFDTLAEKTEENFSYAQVALEPVLYENCRVAWSGRISNAQTNEETYTCLLLIGYEDQKRVDGMVKVEFTPPPVPEIEGERSVKILGEIKIEHGEIELSGCSVYQPLRKK